MAPTHILLTNKKLGWNGEVKAILEIALGLTTRGYRVSVGTNPEAELVRRLAGNPVEILPLELQKKKPAVFGSLPRDMRRLADYVRDESVALVHTHASFDTWTAAGARVRHGMKVPFIRTKHNVKLIRRNPLNRWFYRRGMDFIVAPSQAVLSELRASGLVDESKLRYVPYGIRLDDSEAFLGTQAEAREKLGLDKADEILLYLSRLTARKDPHSLAKAFLRLSENRPRLRLLFVGLANARVQEELDEITRGHPRVEYWGHRNDVPDILATADVFVLPSITEAFGLAPLEAMRQGLPVIVSSAEGFKDFVEHEKSGLVFPAGDVDALASAVERLLDDSALRASLAAKGHEVVESRFNVERMVDDYAALYQEVLALSS